MPYTPNNLTIDLWSSPVTISGTDLIRNLDEAVNTIISTDANSIKNHVNTQLDKIPPYLSSEFNKIYTGVENEATIATTKASEASESATTATNQATIATTKANEAQANAVIAQTQAGIATTKANDANTYQNQAYNYSVDALASKNSAESARDLAITKAQEAVVSASNASSSAVIANAYANVNYGGFSINDGELIVTYNNLATSVPSLVDGDFIITY